MRLFRVIGKINGAVIVRGLMAVHAFRVKNRLDQPDKIDRPASVRIRTALSTGAITRL